jgi:hypothetical protein
LFVLEIGGSQDQADAQRDEMMTFQDIHIKFVVIVIVNILLSALFLLAGIEHELSCELSA